MLRKTVTIVVSFILIMLLVFPAQFAYADGGDDIYSGARAELESIIANTPDGEKIPCYLWFNDLDWSEIEKQAMDYYKDLDDSISESEKISNYSQYLSILQDKAIREYNEKIFSQLGLPKDDIIDDDTGTPCYIINLSKEDIARLKTDPNVWEIFYYRDEDVVADDETISYKIDRKLIDRLGDGVNTYKVLILLKYEPSESLSNEPFEVRFDDSHSLTEKFVQKYLADVDCKYISTVIFAEIKGDAIKALADIPEVASIISAENLTKEDIPEYVREFPRESDVFTATDSLKVQRMALGLDKYKYSEGYDVDSDGKLTNRDAMYILRSTINLENITPAFRYKHKVMRFFKSLDIPTP